MSSSNSVYINEKFSEPMAAQHEFANNFDMNDPTAAMSSYARIMHEHTKKQLNSATNSARRRSEGSTSSSTSLQTVSSASS
ncbi:unnamed protein product [Periconia digitata]|uniref:Uncharacterized protein n=1 Tax=Periconia digitata TaxID=1303443 RepID=A0A9W4U763_9PLEO|nr:unnamed protein product [Periconia digitata]